MFPADIAGAWSQVTFVDRIFIFGFVPLTVGLFWLATRARWQLMPAIILILASLSFYVSWSVKFLLILLLSMIFNFCGRAWMTSRNEKEVRFRKATLAIIITGNLSALVLFKYFNFFLESYASLTGFQHEALAIGLPLGISFYTFQEITLAVDAYAGASRIGFLKYVLFIVFFPHLVAGPLVHHREMVPQFAHLRVRMADIAVGVSLFTIGLFKKVCIADALAPIVKSVFDNTPAGQLQSGWAWLGAIAYAFQIYFDFSGYSDMALGLGRLFGVKLPINFFSPYKALDIAEFWHRWHMTLSRFLREYVYFPLGGNRRGESRRELNLMIVMLVGGLWHGANWTFVLWGGLHGLLLVINRLWRDYAGPFRLPGVVAGPITFSCVVAAWIPFRAADVNGAFGIWKAMLGRNGIEHFSLSAALNEMTQSVSGLGKGLMLRPGAQLTFLLTLIGLCILYAICVALPNSNQIMRLKHPWPGMHDLQLESGSRIYWRPGVLWGFILGLMFGVSMLVSRQLPQEFLYWKF
jgi:alginate O-acetyltransferase complex protein AlgI